MEDNEYGGNATEADARRDSEAIRQDIAKSGDQISQTVEQIGERIKESLDWRGYVKDSPYWALGTAAGLGFLVSRVFRSRATPREKIMRSIAGELRDSLGRPHGSAAGFGLIKATLLGVAMKAVTSRPKPAAPAAETDDGAGPQP